MYSITANLVVSSAATEQIFGQGRAFVHREMVKQRKARNVIELAACAREKTIRIRGWTNRRRPAAARCPPAAAEHRRTGTITIGARVSSPTFEQRGDCHRAEKERHEPPEQRPERQHSAGFQAIPIGQ